MVQGKGTKDRIEEPTFSITIFLDKFIFESPEEFQIEKIRYL